VKISSLLFTLVLLSTNALSEEIKGRVIGIADGDTLTVLVNEHDQIKVRLAEIDAPEKSQPFGQRSKQSLSDLCFNTEAVLQTTGIDRYGRTLAKVYCSGIDANTEQVKTGLAWAYRKYLHDQSLLELESEARTSKRGLWADNDPVPPWGFRKLKRGKSAISIQTTPTND
jgi:endonuclease YncB( thermonuclease family)